MRLDDTPVISAGEDNAALTRPLSETDAGRGITSPDTSQSDRDAGKPRSASGDVLDLSQEGRDVAEAKAELNRQVEESVDNKLVIDEVDTKDDAISLNSEAAETEQSMETGAAVELTPEEEEQVRELKARDAEVRTHEQAHVSAGGAYVTGGPSYTYQTGPDGNKYAIGGEVGIDTSEVSGDPEATIRKMQTVAQAAMAPAEPSGQDHKVAAAARQKEAQARAELARQAGEVMSSNSSAEESEAAMPSSDMATSDQVSAAESRITEAKQTDSAPSFSRQSSAYQAQSTMSLNTASRISQFSAFV